MTVCKNGSLRCDWCGRLSRHIGKVTADGEYLRSDGVTVGYIHAANRDGHGNALDDKDICTDCDVLRRATPTEGRDG